jgi:hypothetical protein
MLSFRSHLCCSVAFPKKLCRDFDFAPSVSIARLLFLFSGDDAGVETLDEFQLVLRGIWPFDFDFDLLLEAVELECFNFTSRTALELDFFAGARVLFAVDPFP